MAKVGDRVELVFTSDPYTKLEPGERGTVGFVDGIGTIHVNWDSGSFLGLVPGEDRWTTITEEEEAADG